MHARDGLTRRLGDSGFEHVRMRRGRYRAWGYVLAAAWKPLDLSKIAVEWEHDYNQLVGQRFRVLASLNVLWIK